MAEKLKSVLKIIQLQLILKSLIFAGLLFWARVSDFKLLPVLLFLALSFILYFRNYEQNNRENIYSFFVLLIISLLGASLLDHFQFLIAAIIFFSFLFYLFLGIKNLAFARRYDWNSAKNLLLLHSVFLTYFLSDKYNLFLLKFVGVFVAVFIIVREWFLWLEIKFPKRYQLASFIFSFLILQIVWAVSILPLGFINSAILTTVFVYLMFDLCSSHFRGAINKKLIARDFIILASSLFVIFLFTNWKI